MKYGAVERNFEILKKVSLKQQDDFHQVMKHSNTMEQRAAHFEKEYLAVKEIYETVLIEKNKLKKKESEYEAAISERIRFKHEINTITADRDKLFFTVKSLEEAALLTAARLVTLNKDILREKKI